MLFPDGRFDLIKLIERKKLTKKVIVSWVRYFIVGLSTFTLDFLLNWFLIKVVLINYLFVGYIASPVVILFNFSMHKVWSFTDVGSQNGKTRKQVVRYAILVSFNAIANMGLMYLFYGLLSLPLIWARVACVSIAILWNFPVFRYWVYASS